jgi:tetratricopeptide (TPR) repeat protein
MIVSTTETTALDCVPLGAGAGLHVGISPASAVTERTPASATAARNRFIDSFPFLELRRYKVFYIVTERTAMQDALQGGWQQTNIPFAVALRPTPTRKALYPMKIASAKLDTAHLPANDRALRLCSQALELKDRGNYGGAREVMRPIWPEFGKRPHTTGLTQDVTAEVLLCTGVLTSWVGSQNQVRKANDWARDLLNESIRIYEEVGDLRKVAQARTEIAYCYWRSGALNEARIMFSEALQKLTIDGSTKANALLGLSVVEWSSSRYDEALNILRDNATAFRKITNHYLKGFYHNQLAMILRNLGTEGKRDDYFQQAIKEYVEAEAEFKLARNTLFRAEVNNNVGFLLYKLGRLRHANRYLNEARRLAVAGRNRVVVAQIDDTRAQVLIAEKRFKEASTVARSAVKTFEKSGHQCLLADALINYGIALARLSKTDQAQFTFQQAIEIAHQVGALNKAGIGALILIEEIDRLPLDVLLSAHDNAYEWLADCQSEGLSQRQIDAGRKVINRMRVEAKLEGRPDALFNKGCSLPDEMLKFERALIRQALARGGGSIVHAARWLGVGYQRLSYTIESRHKDLLKERTPVCRRARKNQ